MGNMIYTPPPSVSAYTDDFPRLDFVPFSRTIVIILSFPYALVWRYEKTAITGNSSNILLLSTSVSVWNKLRKRISAT